MLRESVAVAVLTIAALVASGCTASTAPTPTPTDAASAEHPIQIVDGGFVDTQTGDPFPVRGTNYFNIVPADGGLEDRFFSPAVFDVATVEADFRSLAEHGYTTVRLFIDSCSVGPDCISRIGVNGLNPAYLESIAETMRIAQKTGLFLLLTSNDLPDGGEYTEIAYRNNPAIFEGYRNSVFLTPTGAEAAVTYWNDLLTGLAELGAPFEAVLAWSIVNEMWVFKEQPPLNLRTGIVRGADGEDYDMADATQRRGLVLAGFTHYLDSVAAVIRSHDPGGLVTSGFFAPQFPNQTTTGGDWYVDTAPLMGTVDLDFFDFHAYPGGDITLAKLAENFGMPAAPNIPVVMGESGAFLHDFATVESAALALQQWTAESCEAGFDGWLHWGYLRAPVAIGDATWGLVDNDGYLLRALAPAQWPDPCIPTLKDPDLARSGTATASNSLPDEPPVAAIDGEPGTQWGSGGDAPQWLEVQLSAETVGSVRLHVAQYPAGRTVHEVAVQTTSGEWLTVGVADGVTDDGDLVEVSFAPVENVVAVRVTTTVSPSWVAWRAVEVLAVRSD
jgi:hypothetical protein